MSRRNSVDIVEALSTDLPTVQQRDRSPAEPGAKLVRNARRRIILLVSAGPNLPRMHLTIRTRHLLTSLLLGGPSPSLLLCPLPLPPCLLHLPHCHAHLPGHQAGLLSGQQHHPGTLSALVDHGHFPQSLHLLWHLGLPLPVRTDSPCLQLRKWPKTM